MAIEERLNDVNHNQAIKDIKVWEILFNHYNKEDFKNYLINKINTSKNSLLDDCLFEFEQKLKKEYNSIIESLKLREMKNIAKKEINNLITNGENIAFQGINSIILEPDEKGQKYKSEFDRFDKLAGKTIDKKICNIANDIEDKLMYYAGNLDKQAEEYLQMIYPQNIDKKLFDYLREKKNNILKSKNIQNVNNALIKIGQSDKLNKINNFVNAIDLEKVNSILDVISNISNKLKPINKETFKNTIKNKIVKELLILYEQNLENELKNLIQNTCNYIITKLGNAIVKNIE